MAEDGRGPQRWAHEDVDSGEVVAFVAGESHRDGTSTSNLCSASVEGKVVKNRLHLDVRVGTGLVGDERVAALEAECARLIPLGKDTEVPLLKIRADGSRARRAP